MTETVVATPDATVDPQLSDEGQKLRELAGKADSGQVTDAPEVEPETQTETVDSTQEKSEDRAPDAEAEVKPDNSDTSAERQRDEKGRFVPKEPVSPETQPKTEAKPSKAEKDEHRLARNWQEFEAGKLKWQQDMAAKLEAAEKRAQEAYQRVERVEQAGRPAQGQQYSSQDYAYASQQFEARAQQAYKDGDPDKGDELMGFAQKARYAANDAYTQEYQEYTQKQQQSLIEARQKDITALKEKHPEIVDPTTEDYKAMEALYNATPVFQMMPDGFTRCYELVQLQKRARAAEVAELRAKELEKQLKELQTRTAITGSGPTHRSSPQSTDDMSQAELGEYLRRQAAHADAGMVTV